MHFRVQNWLNKLGQVGTKVMSLRKRSRNHLIWIEKISGAKRTRTADPLHAMQITNQAITRFCNCFCWLARRLARRVTIINNTWQNTYFLSLIIDFKYLFLWPLHTYQPAVNLSSISSKSSFNFSSFFLFMKIAFLKINNIKFT